jgi:ketosteroid isomerase-like protein
MTHGNSTDDELAELVQRTAEAASAYIRGDIRRYTTLIEHADDYTLMAPYGGEVIRDVDSSEEALQTAEQWFKSGTAEQELVQALMSGDIAVLVVIERQHGEVGGLPDQDYSLRVTLVFRREESVAVGTSSRRPAGPPDQSRTVGRARPRRRLTQSGAAKPRCRRDIHHRW